MIRVIAFVADQLLARRRRSKQRRCAFDVGNVSARQQEGTRAAFFVDERSRRTPYPLDSRTYKRRNLIERMFYKLKNWRRIATRYDRYAQNYLSGLALAAIMIAWI